MWPLRRTVAHFYHARRNSDRDRERGNIARHDGVGADDRAIADRHAFENGDFGAQPNVAPDFHRRARRALRANRDIRAREIMIVIADRNHFGQQTIVADFDAFFAAQSAMMPENHARAERQIAGTFDGRVVIQHASGASLEVRAGREPQFEARANIAVRAEFGARKTKAQPDQARAARKSGEDASKVHGKTRGFARCVFVRRSEIERQV